MVGQRLAEEHEDHAHHLAVAVAQLLPGISLRCQLAQDGRLWIQLRHVFRDHHLGLAEQQQAGRASQRVFAVGQRLAIKHGCQSGGAWCLPLLGWQQAAHAADLCAQRLGHVAGQLHKEFGARAGRHGSGHFEHRGLQALLLMACAQAHDAEGQVVGQLLQQGGFVAADVQNFWRIQVQQAKGLLAFAQGQADHGMKPVPQHALGPVGKAVVGADVLHDHGLAAAHGHPGRAPPKGAAFGPAQLQLFEIPVVVARMGHRFDGLGFVIERKADPSHAVAANVHGDLADFLQQSGLGGGAHQGLVAGAQQALRPAHAAQVVFGAQALGDVDGQHLAGRRPIEADVARRNIHVHRHAVLVQMAAHHGGVAWLQKNVLQPFSEAGAILWHTQVCQLHLQQLGLGVAIVRHHGLVHRQQAQAVFGIHPHGMRMLVEQHAVLQLGGVQLAGHLAQLHHGAQGFGQDFQVGHAAGRKGVGLVGGDQQRSHHGIARPQGHRRHRAQAARVGKVRQVPAFGFDVMANDGAGLAERGPQQAQVHRQWVAQGAHHDPGRRIDHQVLAFEQVHLCTARAGLVQHRAGHHGQHFGQRQVDG